LPAPIKNTRVVLLQMKSKVRRKED